MANLERQTRARRVTTVDQDRASAIARGIEALKQRQERDGCWKSTPDMGPLGLAITALTEHWLDALSDGDAQRFAASLKRAQLPDGGFEVYPGAGVGSLGTTAVCRAALKACGVSDAAPAVRRAEALIASLGGYSRVRERMMWHGEPAALFCVMVGLLPAEVLPPVSPDMAALPWSERMLDGRMHGGVPMLIYACAAVRERQQRKSLLPGFLRAPARLLARSRLASYIGQFQNPDGSWNAAVYCTVFNLIALEGVGLSKADPMVRRGLAWLDSRKRRTADGLTVSIFDGEVWETAFSLMALSACGVPASDRSVALGVRYLEGAQCTAQQPRLNQPKPDAPRTGGWAFQAGNETMPDCDDTGMALAALARCGVTVKRRPSAAIEAGVAWLKGMQNEGGGFGSYVHGLPDKPAGEPLFVNKRPMLADLTGIMETLTNPPPELGDAAIADVVGRALWGLGECGLDTRDPCVARAVAFLERDARRDGSWWGIWNPAYVAGTSFAIVGLASVRANLKSKHVERAARWLVEAQNPDGGYGEQPGSFLEPSLAATGPSMASLTGIALRALSELVAARAASPEVHAAATRAAAYLLGTQQRDGSWPDDGYLFTIIPPTFYRWEHHRLYYPLLGLGRWHEVAGKRAAKGRAS